MINFFFSSMVLITHLKSRSLLVLMSIHLIQSYRFSQFFFFCFDKVEVWYAIAGTHKTLVFNNVTRGLGEVELGFRLVHLWEARNTSRGGMLISIEQVWNHCPLPIMFRLKFQIQWLTSFIYQRVLLYHLFDCHSLSICLTHNSVSRKPGGDWLR